jgi:hypothetical protein
MRVPEKTKTRRQKVEAARRRNKASAAIIGRLTGEAPEPLSVQRAAPNLSCISGI